MFLPIIIHPHFVFITQFHKEKPSSLVLSSLDGIYHILGFSSQFALALYISSGRKPIDLQSMGWMPSSLVITIVRILKFTVIDGFGRYIWSCNTISLFQKIKCISAFPTTYLKDGWRRQIIFLHHIVYDWGGSITGPGMPFLMNDLISLVIDFIIFF